jgi:hypothetical protein
VRLITDLERSAGLPRVGIRPHPAVCVHTVYTMRCWHSLIGMVGNPTLAHRELSWAQYDSVNLSDARTLLSGKGGARHTTGDVVFISRFIFGGSPSPGVSFARARRTTRRGTRQHACNAVQPG